MSELIFHRATASDVEALTELRAVALHAANELSADIEIPRDVYNNARDFYSRKLADGSHVAYIVYDGEAIVGLDGVTFYELIPMYYNRTGKCAAIVNMYTAPGYRRRGIAGNVLDLLIGEVRAQGLASVQLEATRQGRLLYESCGFKPDGSMMVYAIDAV